ncbi:MAG: metallophosphoesterase [Pseudomonadota bacterium]
MPQQIYLFISLALSLYFGLHLLLFWLVVTFFNLKSNIARFRLGAFLFVLSLSFILAFFWVRFSGHHVLRWFYYGSALWLGILINLLIILGVGLLLFTILKWLAIGINLKSLGFILLGLTALTTIYGLYNATQIKIKFLSVPVKNRPREWQGKKIAHLSDLHLGILNRKDLTRKVADRINAQGVDLVFITGDLFDGSGDNLADCVDPLNKIKAPIFYITGNHETYLGIAKTVAAIEKTKIRLLRDEMVDLGGVQLIGIDYPPRGTRKNLEPILQKIDKSKPGILLYHEPSNRESARRFNISLQLSGHTHNGQMWPMKIFTHLIYKGYDYGLHQTGDYFIYTTSGVGTWGPPMRIGSTPEIAIITIQ